MSNFLSVTNLHLHFPGQPSPLFRKLDMHFQKGWTGVVGKNGAGKTTLARILSGQLQPDKGTILPIHSVGILHQLVDLNENELEEWISKEPGNFGRWRSLLQLHLESTKDYPSLSYGEKRKLQMAKVLSEDSKLLLLDEPTNHLDEATSRFIRKAIHEFEGIGVLISHDISLLDEFCQSILFLENGSGIQIPGNFTEALKEKERIETRLREDYINLRKEQKRINNSYLEKKNLAMRSDKIRSKKGIHPKDHDMRAKKQHARLTRKRWNCRENAKSNEGKIKRG